MVAIGTCATVLAASYMFMSASGIVGAAVPQSGSTADHLNAIDAMEWVQPALGQAIVDDLLVGREASSRIAAAAMKLNRDILAAQALQASPFGFLGDIKTQTAAMADDPAARVQFAMGRSIVNFTARGVRTGVLSPRQPSGPYNRLMIRITEAVGAKMDEEFQRNHQANVGGVIVAAVQNHDRFVAQVQERVAHAVVQVRTTRAHYEQALGDIQEQTRGGNDRDIPCRANSEPLPDRVGRANVSAAIMAGNPYWVAGCSIGGIDRYLLRRPLDTKGPGRGSNCGAASPCRARRGSIS